MFYCADLFQYIREMGRRQKREKRMVLVLNKADLVPLEARTRWSEYLAARKIQHMFFSALREETILKAIFNAKEADTEQKLRHGDLTLDDIPVAEEKEEEQ